MFKQWTREHPPCEACKVTPTGRGMRCDECMKNACVFIAESMLSGEVVLQGESDSPAEEN